MAEYEVTIPATETLLVPKPTAWHRDEEGNVVTVETVGVVRHMGDIVDESELTPAILDALKNGDERINSLFALVGAPKPAKAAKATKVVDEDAEMRKTNVIAEQISRNPIAGKA